MNNPSKSCLGVSSFCLPSSFASALWLLKRALQLTSTSAPMMHMPQKLHCRFNRSLPTFLRSFFTPLPTHKPYSVVPDLPRKAAPIAAALLQSAPPQHFQTKNDLCCQHLHCPLRLCECPSVAFCYYAFGLPKKNGLFSLRKNIVKMHPIGPTVPYCSMICPTKFLPNGINHSGNSV